MMRKKNGLIITSNLFIDDLGRKYQDDRIPDRLSGICEVIKIDTGYDFRMEARG